MVRRGRAGFTLVEAIVALTLSSVLVILVGTTFLVQNRYYAVQVERSAAQDNARMVTEMIASEIRSLMASGVVTAENHRLVVRSPMALALVCSKLTGQRYSVYMEGGDTLIDTSEVGGIAMLNADGTWTYSDDVWPNFFLAKHAAGYCSANGADTVGAGDEFIDMKKLDKMFGLDPAVGQVLMVYRKVEYSFGPSGLDPSTVALFRRLVGGSAVEFATGMDTSSQFMYRRAGGKFTGDYVTSVGSTELGAIDAIRIEAEVRRAIKSVQADDVTFGWAVNVPLRNAR